MPGSGVVVGSDGCTISAVAVEVQYVKILDATAGGTNPAAVSANGLKVDGSGVTQPISGTFWQTTQPVSAAALPLPSGAATVAKQPALGTAGSASADVITVQGVASMTALKVDPSGVTSPVSGTVTANAGTGPFPAAGMVASGSANANNPVKIGGPFNTTQPTVTNAQIVDAQMTARGAQIVATGVDAFTAAATQSGTWTVQPGNTANTTAWKVDGSAVTQPVSLAALPALVTGAATIGSVKITDGSNIPAVKAASTAVVATDPALVVQISQNSPIQAMTQSGTFTVTPANTANTTAWLVSNAAATAGGWTASSQTALTNTKTAVKASAGNFGGYMFYNPNSVAIYIQVWDVASASVTVGTTAPTYVIPLPALSGANLEISLGISHATAIVIAATTTPTGSTAPATALTGFVLFK